MQPDDLNDEFKHDIESGINLKKPVEIKQVFIKLKGPTDLRNSVITNPRENPKTIKDILKPRIPPAIWQIIAVIFAITLLITKSYGLLIANTTFYILFAICNIYFNYFTIEKNELTKKTFEQIKDLNWFERLYLNNIKYELDDEFIGEKYIHKDQSLPLMFQPPIEDEEIKKKLKEPKITIYDDSHIKIDVNVAINPKHKPYLNLIYLLGIVNKNYSNLDFEQLKSDITQETINNEKQNHEEMQKI